MERGEAFVGHQLDLHIFIDAFGWRILENHAFLDDQTPHRRPLRTVAGYSCAAVPALLTGRSPADLRRLSFYYYDPANSPFRRVSWPLRLLPGLVANRGRVRRHISRAVGRWLGFTGYFQLYNVPFQHLGLFSTCETTDIFAHGGLSPCRSIFDFLRDRNVELHCSDWRADETTNLRAAERAVRREETRWAFVYLPALDGLMHAEGTKSPAVGEKIAFYDQWVRRLCEAACHDHVRLTVVSDHGMSDVTQHCDVEREINQLGLQFGRDYVAFYDSTMARFWYLNAAAQDRIESRLRELPCGSVLTPDELRRSGADFADQRFGQTIFLVRPGRLIVPSFMGRTGLAAMHGYTPDDADADAMMVCSEPIAPEVAAITDVFQHMTESLQEETRSQQELVTS